VCASTVACLTYSWDAADFDGCPTGCGLSESTLFRVVLCLGSDGVVSPGEAVCVDPKPVERSSCAATADCLSYGWEAPDFIECESGCGLTSLVLNRTVACVGSDSTPTSTVLNCTGPKPAATILCIGTAACANGVTVSVAAGAVIAGPISKDAFMRGVNAMMALATGDASHVGSMSIAHFEQKAEGSLRLAGLQPSHFADSESGRAGRQQIADTLAKVLNIETESILIHNISSRRQLSEQSGVTTHYAITAGTDVLGLSAPEFGATFAGALNSAQPAVLPAVVDGAVAHARPPTFTTTVRYNATFSGNASHMGNVHAHLADASRLVNALNQETGMDLQVLSVDAVVIQWTEEVEVIAEADDSSVVTWILCAVLAAVAVFPAWILCAMLVQAVVARKRGTKVNTIPVDNAPLEPPVDAPTNGPQLVVDSMPGAPHDIEEVQPPTPCKTDRPRQRSPIPYGSRNPLVSIQHIEDPLDRGPARRGSGPDILTAEPLELTRDVAAWPRQPPWEMTVDVRQLPPPPPSARLLPRRPAFPGRVLLPPLLVRVSGVSMKSSWQLVAGGG
jgi:hypothetical protein